MKTSDKVKAILKSRGIRQAQFAEEMDVSQPTVARWLAGADPEQSRRLQIEAMYDREVGMRPTTVPVMGYLGAGAEVMPDFEQVPHEGLDQIEVPFDMPDDMIAFVVRGDSMLPVFKDGHVVVVYRDQKKPLESFYGQEAAVRTTDGRRFIKTVMRGAPGINLFSWNAAPIENVRLDWIGEIFAILPRTSLR
ncbi:LexA family transcriptional regulator [Phyllobacterium sp. OV277]|uniref:LexA family transcriptional regulator n=1 Tax=Phyllobacterium sp. OV277 TaxID=1882772 RepID=UPI00087DFEEE|nr:LexA family transcriptional regulator [Phyllobacterium sp. OV277]SDP09180.1 Phage repressor protein C, contains Cro/C1-type HTH and peptisase s24 domains [Phyllobacterium sp. OV277]